MEDKDELTGESEGEFGDDDDDEMMTKTIALHR